MRGRAPLLLGRSAWAGAGLLGLFVVVALVGPFVAPFSPTQQDLDHLLARVH